MTAVAAFPNLNAGLFKDLLRFHIVQQRTVAFLMGLFNGADRTETLGKRMKALLLGVLRHSCIHIGPFGVFTLCCVQQVFGGVTQFAELLEPELCVLFFVFSGLKEQGCDLLVACLLCHGGEVGVLVSCLRLACKGFPKILFGFSACVLVCHVLFLLNDIIRQRRTLRGTCLVCICPLRDIRTFPATRHEASY